MDETNDQTPQDETVETPESAGPDTVSPEMASSSGLTPGPQPIVPAAPVTATQPAPQPVQVVAAHPRATLFHSIMETLGGGDKTQYSVDPQTGTMTAQRVPQTTGQLAKGILAGALTGLAAGAGERGPGSVGRSAQQGFAAVQQQRQLQDLQAKQQAQQDYTNRQKALVQKAQMFEANARTLMNLQQAAKLGQERAQGYVSGFDKMYEQAEQDGRIVQDNVSEAEAQQMLQSGKFKASDVLFVPREARPNDKGGVDYVGAIVDNHPMDISKDPENVSKAQQNGFLRGQPAQGARMPVSAWSTVVQKNAMVDNAEAEMKKVHDTLGTAADQMPNFADAIKTPGMGEALYRFQGYVNSAAHQDIASAISAMGQKTKVNAKTGQSFTNPDAALVPLVVKAFGGQDVIDKYEQKIQADQKANQIKEDAEARAQAEANTPKGKQDLINAQLTAEEKRLQIKKLQSETPTDLSKLNTNTVADPNVKFSANDPAYPVNQNALTQLNQQDPGMAALVQAIGEGREQMTAQAARTKDGQSVMKAVNIIYPRYNAAKVESYFKGRQTATSGTVGNKTNSFATAMQHLQRYYDNITSLAANPVTGTIEENLGVGNAKALETDRIALATEIASAYKSGVPSKEEIDKWEQRLGGPTAGARRQGAVETAKLLHGKFNEYANQYRNMIPPGIKDDTLQIMSNDAANAYKHVTGQSIGNTQPLTQGPNAPQNQFQVVTPKGTYNFPTQQAADQFRKAANIQ